MAAWFEALVKASYVAALFLFVAGAALTMTGQLLVFQLGGLSSVGLASISPSTSWASTGSVVWASHP